MNRFFHRATQRPLSRDATLYQQIINPSNSYFSHQPVSQFLTQTRNQALKLQKNCKKVDRYPSQILAFPVHVNPKYLQTFDWKKSSVMGFGAFEEGILFIKEESFLLERETKDSEITSFKFSEDGEIAFLGTSFGQIEMYNSNSLKHVRTAGTVAEPITCMQTLAREKVLIGKSSGEVKLYDLRQKDGLIQQYNPPYQIVCQSVTHNDTAVSVGFGDGNIRVLDMRKSLSPFLTLSSKTTEIKGLSWCPWKPHILASGGKDGKIRLWNCYQQQLQQEIDSGCPISQLMWAPMQKLLLSSHLNGFCYGWNSSTCQLEQRLIRHQRKILSMKLNPADEHELVTFGYDLKLKFWSIMMGEPKVSPLAFPNMQIR